jgi:tRNA-Thr(GGU) m(6)t(6)A37 methyltransferase TsaA
MRDFQFREIAIIQSCYPDKFGTPRQSAVVPLATGKISFHKDWQPESSLQGLENYSHLWILFVFHLNTNRGFHAKVHPPRLGGQSLGVFATRSPHRPNPIGQSVVKIEKIEESEIWVSGIDLVDGTPIIDIKPYLPETESIPDAKSHLFAQLSKPLIQVIWKQEALSILEKWQNHHQVPLRELIESTVAQDPRPVLYRGSEGQESTYRQTHAVRIFDGDIHFRFINQNEIEIFNVYVKSPPPK